MVDLAECPVLVTGGAGFIGSALVRQLAAAGARVVVVDNLVNGQVANLHMSEGQLIAGVEFVHCDVRDTEAMRPLVREAKLVFHLACLGVRHSIHSPLENHQVNATATLQLLELAREAKLQRFVYVSTSEAYGTASQVPMSEEHPTCPTTVYGASKLAGERYTHSYGETYDLPVTVVRPFNAYGPRCHHEGDSGEVIPKFMLRCLASRPMVVFGDGSQTRDFTYVEDTARGILLAGVVPGATGGTFNIGHGREITIRELAEQVANVVGGGEGRIEHAAPRPGDVLRLCADASRARSVLGYEPQVSLGEGLARLLSWYQQNPQTPDELLEDEVVENWRP